MYYTDKSIYVQYRYMYIEKNINPKPLKAYKLVDTTNNILFRQFCIKRNSVKTCLIIL